MISTFVNALSGWDWLFFSNDSAIGACLWTCRGDYYGAHGGVWRTVG